MIQPIPPVVAPYLIGLVTAPPAAKIIKPLLRGIVKATVGIGLAAKKLVVEAGEEFQDLTAEVSADLAADTAAKNRLAADAAAKTEQARGAGVVK